MNLLYIACGGFIGANARYFLGVALNRVNPLRPFGTWIANITGSFLLGILFIFLENHMISPSIWLLFGTGFCGAFTTFSTFGTEILSMLIEKKYLQASFYCLSSIGVSLVAVSIILLLN
ncbi:Putative fluoride ion transporter CrcB [Paraliobacillus sp. PM-2]|uniref:fluoride efflux transporter CrcB n=1 Tax=Paraliobacillus sp. PM-2 TaxID=1462524 RepID=UPI00061BD982|nr:fluoride efflux transporter CrcB [Paraliobacillus sp. PM-2]CQR46524.1 Putative fluoride ion transporter CrcB [Paraliobacillus sp. PM-2]